MANLFDYLTWRGDISFKQVPFNKLDALLLSHLSYSIFDGLLTDSFEEKKTLAQLAEDFRTADDYEKRINIGFLINKQTAELMFACAKTERFKDVEICGYKVVSNEDTMEQFAAMVYLAGGKTIISYRGTDDTIVGWREDFNLAWQDQLPAQKDAIDYLKAAAEEFKGKLTLVGHSKGGNLVINSAVNCPKRIQNRLEKLYNFDGPGFSKEFLEKPEYKAIESRIWSIYPEFSVVGMIFHHNSDFEIVKSDGFAVMQHDILSWQILGAGVDKADDFTPECKFFSKTFNEWVDGLEVEQTKKFVNALFDVIEASEVETLNELDENPLVCAAKMFQKLSSLDKTTKAEVRKVLKMLKSVLRKDSPIAKVLTLQKNKL